MKKSQSKKPAVKKVKPVEAVVPTTAAVSDPIPTTEDKPKVIFAPEVEKSSDQPVSPEAGGVTVEVGGQPETDGAGAQSAKTDVPQPDSADVKSEKLEVPGGELARSINTLAKIVDQDKPADQAAGVSPQPVSGVPVEKKSRGGRGGGALGVFLAFVIGLCLGLLAGYGLWGRYVAGRVSDSLKGGNMEKQAVVSPTVSVTPVPEEVVTEKRDIKVKVLNGTGGRGVAAAGKEYLESLGYVGVETGNAKRSDYAKTEVVLMTTKTDYWPVLKADLGAKYTLMDGFTTDDELLLASGGVDALVIIGE